MWIVALALRRPYTFVVMALVILLLTPLVILRTPTDIFPDINIPVISVIWIYTGMPPEDMAERIVTISERGITITVNDIEHIESQSLNGVGVIKVFFQPNANIQTAISQVTAIVQTAVRSMPPGTTPPIVIIYTASTTPDHSARPQQQDVAGAAALRSGTELPAHPPDDRPRRRYPVSVRRQDAPDTGGPGYPAAASARALARSTSSTRSTRRT